MLDATYENSHIGKNTGGLSEVNDPRCFTVAGVDFGPSEIVPGILGALKIRINPLKRVTEPLRLHGSGKAEVKLH